MVEQTAGYPADANWCRTWIEITSLIASGPPSADNLDRATPTTRLCHARIDSMVHWTGAPLSISSQIGSRIMTRASDAVSLLRYGWQLAKRYTRVANAELSFRRIYQENGCLTDSTSFPIQG